MTNNNFQNLSDILANKTSKKPPAYEWQDFALKIIKELNIPGFKRSSVFKICKTLPKEYVEACLNDTKELCKSKDKWGYFFKVVSNSNSKKPTTTQNS